MYMHAANSTLQRTAWKESEVIYTTVLQFYIRYIAIALELFDMNLKEAIQTNFSNSGDTLNSRPGRSLEKNTCM